MSYRTITSLRMPIAIEPLYNLTTRSISSGNNTETEWEWINFIKIKVCFLSCTTLRKGQGIESRRYSGIGLYLFKNSDRARILSRKNCTKDCKWVICILGILNLVPKISWLKAQKCFLMFCLVKKIWGMTFK